MNVIFLLLFFFIKFNVYIIKLLNIITDLNNFHRLCYSYGY